MRQVLDRQIGSIMAQIYSSPKVDDQATSNDPRKPNLNVSHIGAKSAAGDISYLSKNDINDQWYNFIFEDGDRCDVSEFRLDKTDLDKSAISRSRMSNISRFSR